VSDYDKLSVPQKLEAFEYALEKTEGDDLEKILWIQSKNSEVSTRCEHTSTGAGADTGTGTRQYGLVSQFFRHGSRVEQPTRALWLS
jgi:hypothetical protein